MHPHRCPLQRKCFTYPCHWLQQSPQDHQGHQSKPAQKGSNFDFDCYCYHHWYGYAFSLTVRPCSYTTRALKSAATAGPKEFSVQTKTSRLLLKKQYDLSNQPEAQNVEIGSKNIDWGNLLKEQLAYSRRSSLFIVTNSFIYPRTSSFVPIVIAT